MALLLMILLWIAGSAPCAEEDGHTQNVCVWSDGTGVPVLNLDYGSYWLTLGGE